jgi:hypothetical protein
MASKIQQKRILYYCPHCEEPLATQKGDSFFVRKKSCGKYLEVEIEIQNPVGSPVRLACGNCKKTSAIFVTLRAKPLKRKKK